MVVLNATQVANAWTAAGGPKRTAVAWTAVSLSESGFDTEATSPTDAHGLWQIEPYSWPPGAGDPSQWDNPFYNAEAAVIISGGGVNFAPWDTAYADIGASGRYTFLAWPEKGSAAWNNMMTVQGSLGSTAYGTGAPPEVPGLTGSLPDAIRWYSETAHTVIPVLTSTAIRFGATARKMY